jgi:hypothetical protein
LQVYQVIGDDHGLHKELLARVISVIQQVYGGLRAPLNNVSSTGSESEQDGRAVLMSAAVLDGVLAIEPRITTDATPFLLDVIWAASAIQMARADVEAPRSDAKVRTDLEIGGHAGGSLNMSGMCQQASFVTC